MLCLPSSNYIDAPLLLFDALYSWKSNCSLSARFGARAASVSFRDAFITAPWHSLAAGRRDKLNLANLQPGWWVSRDTGEVLGSVGHYVRTYGTSGNADISETKFVNAPCDGAFVTLPVPSFEIFNYLSACVSIWKDLPHTPELNEYVMYTSSIYW
jgi:hypothetical protein